MKVELNESERDALRREIGPPTDRDKKWQPMVSAWEVRGLLDGYDDLAARLAKVAALADEWERQARFTGKAGGDTRLAQFAHSRALRAALVSTPQPDTEEVGA